MPNSDFSLTFEALLKEALFTREILGAGATQIRRANYASKGLYFLAFTSLSTGIERLGKLCLMLDHLAERGAFPDMACLKRDIGHRVLVLYERTSALVARRALQLRFNQSLDSPIHQAVLRCLHDYAEGDRYSNINLLSGSSSGADPIATWYRTVDVSLFEQRVPAARRERIRSNAREVAQLLGTSTIVFHTSETGDTISEMEEASYRAGVVSVVGQYRQLYVLQIIRYWVEVLLKLQCITMGRYSDIPDFAEILGPFLSRDAYLKSRKTWDRL
ncbi:MAG: hypothetical protein U0172_06180 [Nitrospiraceae bacterium]